jgi:hypothetical protein
MVTVKQDIQNSCKITLNSSQIHEHIADNMLYYNRRGRLQEHCTIKPSGRSEISPTISNDLLERRMKKK